MDNLEQNLKAISKALAMMTVFLYETDTKLREVMVISDEKYDNNNESLFYSCYYRNIKHSMIYIIVGRQVNVLR